MLLEALQEAESSFWKAGAHSKLAWSREDLLAACESAGFSDIDIRDIAQKEERFVSPRDIEGWFATKSPWGSFVGEALGAEAFAEVRAALEERAQHGTVTWEWTSLLAQATPAP
jgi:hypothetical protein